MLAQATRAADLEGSPRVRIEAPAEFFARAEAEHESPSVWVGELYLKAHRGTFTSVAAVKAGNRRSEHLLREAELWCATAAVRGLMEYPLARFGELWRQVCLYQFHDILPGTCIAWVYEEVREGFARIADELNALIDEAQRLLAGDPRLHVRVNVDWRERDSLLKLAWPVDVHTDRAAFEIEMGHLVRPTHTNTSWDAHRFEVHAHRWVHVAEPGFGVAIANAQTYGWDVTRHPREGGGTYSLMRASRAPPVPGRDHPLEPLSRHAPVSGRCRSAAASPCRPSPSSPGGRAVRRRCHPWWPAPPGSRPHRCGRRGA